MLRHKTIATNFKDDLVGTRTEDNLKRTVPITRKAFLDEVKVNKCAQLEIIGLDGKKFSKELNKREFTIGRSEDCDLPIPVDDVSRCHARIFFVNEEYYIEDLGSTNGTHVNGISVVKCVLRRNDQIEIGDVKIIFVEFEQMI